MFTEHDLAMPSLTASSILKLENYLHLLAPRPRDSHKGNFGHVLIVGGDVGYAGAARLAAEGALRVGAGLVSIATHPDHAYFLQSTRPELMCHPVKNPEDLAPLMQRASVIAIGPGLGQRPWGTALLRHVLSQKMLPLILDADALNGIAKIAYKPEPNRIFTPHPGEAARLLGLKTITSNRHDLINQLTQQYQGIFVLKGHDTLVGKPDHPLHICHAGNPGMSTAGMGDLLTGVISGLIAQKIPLFESACLSVLLHAMAADQAAEQGERGLIASDVLPYLRRLVNSRSPD